MIDCGNEKEEIVKAIKKAMVLKKNDKLANIKNPYEKAGTSAEIFSVIREYFLHFKGVKKGFFDIVLDNTGDL